MCSAIWPSIARSFWQRGEVWQLATYAFVHSPGNLLWFAIEMYMLFVFGREVERFVGRRAFIVLYATLLLAPTVLLSLWGLDSGSGIAGSPALHFGIFIAFAAIYPNVEMLLRIQAKWVALALTGHRYFAAPGLPRLVGHGRALA